MTTIVKLSFFVDQLFSMILFPHINKPTRIAHEYYSIIYNIFTNVLHDKMHCGILINDTSDHLPVFCITSHELKRKEKKFSTMKNHECLRILNHNLSLENWHSVYSC